MHEVSIVRSIIKTLEQEFEEEKMNRMKAIHIKVGILSNIEPRLLQNAYEAQSLSSPRYQNIQLHLEPTPLKIQCETCNTITQVEQYKFICGNCGRPSKNVIQGEELLIHKVEFDD